MADFPARERPRLNLDNLTDVDAAAPSDGDALVFDSVSGHWKKGPVRVVPTVAKTADATLALTDAGKAVEVTKSSGVTITVPPNSSVAFPIGTELEVIQCGPGRVTLAAGVGVTLQARVGLISTAQWGVMRLRKTATDTWIVSGDAAAS